MENLQVCNVVICKQGKNSVNYEKFKKIVNDRHINVIIAGNDGILNSQVQRNNVSVNANEYPKIQIDNDIYLEILWPNSSKLISENILNNNSIVCKLHYKNFSVLFTGDIEEIAEKQILQEYKENLWVLHADILKVGHHRF